MLERVVRKNDRGGRRIALIRGLPDSSPAFNSSPWEND
jgi:hypothetical protein